MVSAIHKDLSKQIETAKLEDSKLTELQAGNVRGPSLAIGELYIGKMWSTKGMGETDNPFRVVKFLGAGSEGPRGGNRTLLDTLPRLKDLVAGQFYFFEAFGRDDSKLFNMNAYMADECLCVGEPPIRITFYAIKDVTKLSDKQAKAPVAEKPAKPAKPAAKAKPEAPTAEKPKVDKPTKPAAKAKPEKPAPAPKAPSRKRKGAAEATPAAVEEATPEPEVIEEVIPPVSEQEEPNAVAENADRIDDASPAEQEAVEKTHTPSADEEESGTESEGEDSNKSLAEHVAARNVAEEA